MNDLASLAQPRLLSLPGAHGLFLAIGMRPGADPRSGLPALAASIDPGTTVLGLGEPLVAALGASVPGLRGFPSLSGPGVSWPATQGALWLALHGDDPGVLLHEGRRLVGLLGPGFEVEEATPTFMYRQDRDLSGFVDGTENPTGADAVEAALVEGPPGLAGGSFAWVQRWVHDLDRLAAMSTADKEAMFGRTLDDEEIDEAPPDAHVKRTTQEEVGFLLRRSMPWGTVGEAGLVFLAYARDPEVFLSHARRMVGLDGPVDALHRMSRPVTGGLYWCPPVRGSRVCLSAVGLDVPPPRA